MVSTRESCFKNKEKITLQDAATPLITKVKAKKQATVDKIKNQITEYQTQIQTYTQAIIDIQSKVSFKIVEKIYPKKVGKDQVAYQLRTYSTSNKIKYFTDLSEWKNISYLNQEIKSLKSKVEKCEAVLQNQENEIKKVNSKEVKIKETKIKVDKLNCNIKTVLPADKWYSPYHWFYTSENHLVVCGRNSQQNEILVKKYLLS